MLFDVSRARRDFEGMERRRKRAARMFEHGATQADVARELEVSRQSVSRWYADWQRGGSAALKGAGGASVAPQCSATAAAGQGVAQGAASSRVRH